MVERHLDRLEGLDATRQRRHIAREAAAYPTKKRRLGSSRYAVSDRTLQRT